MVQFFKNCLANNLYFWIFGVIATVLLIASFIMPPMGVISSTVLQAGAELFAWATLGAVIHAIDLGKTATLKRGDTQLTVGEDKDE